MTTRSARSTTSRISSKDTVTDGDVYVVSLPEGKSERRERSEKEEDDRSTRSS